MSMPRRITEFDRSCELAGLAGARARTWFLELHEDRSAETRIPLASVLQCLAGCWICEQLLVAEARKPDVQSFADQVERRLKGQEQQAFSALMGCDAALVCLCAGILRALDRRSEHLERFVQQLALSLQGHEDNDPDLFATRFLLHDLGLQSDPGPYHIHSPQLESGTNLFLVDESAIASMAAAIAASTAYGKRPPSAQPELLEQLKAVLPVWMLYYFRQYNIEMGTLLLRAMNYLRLSQDKAVEEGLAFVFAQQQPDGRFGFFAPEVSNLRSKGRDLNDLIDLYLPITVSCLWAIAEVTLEGFSLFSFPGTD